MRAFIHGSCVSRDLLTLLADHGFELNHYSPRQSLIPLLGAVPDLANALDASRLTSRFQRRAVEGTITADVGRELDKRHANVDIVLWDITDERLGVYEVDGGYVTRTIELFNSGLDTSLQAVGRHIAFATDEHFDLWTRGVHIWAEQLRRRGLADRVVVVAPPWAAQFADGTPTPPSTGVSAQQHEALSARYYDAIARELPQAHFIGHSLETRSSAGHRWGPSPFHFDDQTNYGLAEEMYRLGQGLDFPPPRPVVLPAGNDRVRVNVEKTWGEVFALHIYQAKECIHRTRYQASPDFEVPLEPGTYRARLYHKSGDTIVASHSSAFKFPLKAG